MTSPYVELLAEAGNRLEAIQRVRSRLRFDGRAEEAEQLDTYEREARQNLDKAIAGAIKNA